MTKGESGRRPLDVREALESVAKRETERSRDRRETMEKREGTAVRFVQSCEKEGTAPRIIRQGGMDCLPLSFPHTLSFL